MQNFLSLRRPKDKQTKAEIAEEEKAKAEMLTRFSEEEKQQRK